MSLAVPEPRRQNPLAFLIDASSHFKQRATEWGALATLINFSALLHNHPAVMDQPGYQYMARLAGTEAWAAFGAAVGAMHLAALIVNGSVPSIKWTPLVRSVASALGAMFWCQLSLGALFHVGAETVLAPMLVALGLYNTINATSENRGE